MLWTAEYRHVVLVVLINIATPRSNPALLSKTWPFDEHARDDVNEQPLLTPLSPLSRCTVFAANDTSQPGCDAGVRRDERRYRRGGWIGGPSHAAVSLLLRRRRDGADDFSGGCWLVDCQKHLSSVVALDFQMPPRGSARPSNAQQCACRLRWCTPPPEKRDRNEDYISHSEVWTSWSIHYVRS